MDALPSVDALQAMTMEEQKAAYEQLLNDRAKARKY